MLDGWTTLTLRVNGEERPVVFPTHHTLLEVLREECGLTGTKHGCELGDVEYEELPTVSTLEEALAPTPEPLHEAAAEDDAHQDDVHQTTPTRTTSTKTMSTRKWRCASATWKAASPRRT